MKEQDNEQLNEPAMNEDKAQELAISALAWLAEDMTRVGGFLGVTGAGPDDIRSRATDPDFLGFVLDYLLSDDQMVLEFASETDYQPEDVMIARQALPNGATPHWT